MLRPLITIGTLIDRSWETYRAGFADFVSVSGLLLVVALVNVLALALYPLTSKIVAGSGYTGLEAAGVALFAVNNALVWPALGVFTLLGLTKLASARIDGRGLSARMAIQGARKQFWTGIAVAILLVLILLGALAITIVPGSLVNLLGVWLNFPALVVLGSLVMLACMAAGCVFAALWIVRYWFSLYALAVDGGTALQALAASKRAVTGRFWAVILRGAVVNLLFIVVGLLLASLLSVVAGIAVSAAGGLNVDVHLRLISITDSVFPAFAAILVNPLIAIANTLLYRDLTS